MAAPLKRARSFVVEPPSHAAYVTAAYLPGELDNYAVAYISEQDTPPPFNPERDAVRDEIHTFMKVTSERQADPGAEPAPVLGVVYSDGALETHGSDPKPIAIAVLGAVTVVDEAFSDRSHCPPGLFVHVREDGSIELSPRRTPELPRTHLLGMLLEVGYNNDARVLLQ